MIIIRRVTYTGHLDKLLTAHCSGRCAGPAAVIRPSNRFERTWRLFLAWLTTSKMTVM